MPDPGFEIVRRDLPRGPFKAVLFDFDGTLSLIREGWARIMVSMMVDILRATGTRETAEILAPLVEDFVMALNGRPAHFQMARLVEEVSLRGGTAQAPEDYLLEYDRRLLHVVRERSAAIVAGRAARTDWSVPGSHDLLADLRERGLKLYLASGTDLQYVRPEADLLGLSPFFGTEINAPAGDAATFSKRGVIERIIRENGLSGSELLSFGDGVVETQEVRRAGGVAIAVASHEPGGVGVHEEKRARLIAAGADIVIPDYRDKDSLLEWLFAARDRVGP